jgi:hypothetical protein
MMSNYSHSQKCHFLHAFEHVKEHGPDYEYIGVCGNLQATLEKLYFNADTATFAYAFMFDIAEEWPETYVRSNNTRDLEYPIGGASEYFKGKYADMFDKSTEHGLKRYRLIDYCIQRLKDELSS